MRKLFILITLVVLSVGLASAADIYVAQALAGENSGASCVNARALSSLVAGDWLAGNTIHLCGTISSSFAAQGNGAAGNIITIKFEPGAQMSNPAFVAAAIDITNRSYVTVDGGSNGIIQNTANGTLLANKITSRAIDASGGSNIEVKNLTFANLYVHNGLADNTLDHTLINCLYANGFGNNITFDNNTAHDVGWCVTLQASDGQTSTGINFYNNTIYNIDHGVALGMNRATGTPSVVSIHDNHFYDPANWATTANTYHHDAVHLFAYCVDGASVCAGTYWSSIAVYNNLFDGNWGVNNTANVLFQGNVKNADIYNNVSVGYGTVNLNNGSLNVVGTNMRIFNNTFIGSGLTTQTNALINTGGPGTVVRNNIFTTADQLIYVAANWNGVTTTFTGSNNLYSTAGLNAYIWCNPGCTYYNFADYASWATASGETASTTASSANLDSTGHLLAASAGRGLGSNLTSLGINALNSDKAAVARPGGASAWDAGAYQYVVTAKPARLLIWMH